MSATLLAGQLHQAHMQVATGVQGDHAFVASQVAGGGSLEEAVRRADYYMYEQKRDGHEKVLRWLQGELERKEGFGTRRTRESESREGSQE